MKADSFQPEPLTAHSCVSAVSLCIRFILTSINTLVLQDILSFCCQLPWLHCVALCAFKFFAVEQLELILVSTCIVSKSDGLTNFLFRICDAMVWALNSVSVFLVQIPRYPYQNDICV